jgi:phage-related protein
LLYLEDIQFNDFYFNGAWLSDFDGIIAGSNGLSPFSIVPSKEIKTTKILGRHGELACAATYNPRTFEIPVVFLDLSRIREIASWLNVLEPTGFFYEEDGVKIDVMFDSAIDVEHGIIEGKMGGEISLKFIAHNPFFYKISETPLKFSAPFSSSVKFNNDGNFNSYPQIKIVGTGDIIMNINDVEFGINAIDEYVYIDSLYDTVYKGNINKLPNFLGLFPELKPGANTFSITGGTGMCTSIEILCRSRWI